MGDKKGIYKRYEGRITVEATSGKIVNAIIDGLVNNGIEAVSNPIIDDEGRFLGEVIDCYEII